MIQLDTTYYIEKVVFYAGDGVNGKLQATHSGVFSSNMCALYKTNAIYWTIAVITTLWETDADVIQNISC